MEPVGSGKLEFDNADESDFISAVKFGPDEKIDQRNQQKQLTQHGQNRGLERLSRRLEIAGGYNLKSSRKDTQHVYLQTLN